MSAPLPLLALPAGRSAASVSACATALIDNGNPLRESRLPKRRDLRLADRAALTGDAAFETGAYFSAPSKPSAATAHRGGYY